jgi:hypothetical protein
LALEEEAAVVGGHQTPEAEVAVVVEEEASRIQKSDVSVGLLRYCRCAMVGMRSKLVPSPE